MLTVLYTYCAFIVLRSIIYTCTKITTLFCSDGVVFYGSKGTIGGKTGIDRISPVITTFCKRLAFFLIQCDERDDLRFFCQLCMIQGTNYLFAKPKKFTRGIDIFFNITYVGKILNCTSFFHGMVV